MNVIRGTFEEITSSEFYSGTGYQDDYMRIILTDEDDIPDAAAKLRIIYQNLVRIEYDNTRTRHRAELGLAEEVNNKSPLELFSELYISQNGMPFSEEQEKYLKNVIEEIWEDQE
jgi:exonuclease SbcD